MWLLPRCCLKVNFNCQLRKLHSSTWEVIQILQFFQSSWQPGKDTKQMAQKAGLKYGMTSEEAEAAAANAESWASVSWANGVGEGIKLDAKNHLT